MTYCSNITMERIKQRAREEFLEKGYQNANLRDIAKNAQVTTGALYRHFKNKNDLFYSIVKKVYEKTIEILQYSNETDNICKRMEEYSFDTGMEKMSIFMDFIYDNMQEFRLLLIYSKGSSVENFLERLIELYTESNMEFIEKAYKEKVVSNIPSKIAVHFLTSGFLTSIFEVVIHETSRKEADEYFRTIGLFQYHGWNGLLEIKMD